MDPLSNAIQKPISKIKEEEIVSLIPKAKSLEQINEEKELRDKFLDCYFMTMERLKFYCDLKEEYYPIISLWIIGTYFHHSFPTYSYLFFNAMKGSGKSRLLKLIAYLSKDGEVLNGLTEATLFRERGTLCIDEFEGITRTGKENLRELLNSAYKQGTKVKRMKKAKTSKGEEQIVEKFEVYRPIAMANIWGMEEVLGDRCLTLILEKSEKIDIINLMEIFEMDEVLNSIKTTLNTLTTQNQSELVNWCSLCSVVTLWNVYKDWNFYTKNNYISTLTTITTYNYTKLHLEEFFKKIKESKIDGRNLELTFPLFLIAFELEKISSENLLENNEILEDIIKIIQDLVSERKIEEFTESKDISLIDFLAQESESEYDKLIMVSELTNRFKEFLQSNEEWLNVKWMGRRLKTLGLRKQEKRAAGGVKVIPNYSKAKEKIKMFKTEEVK